MPVPAGPRACAAAASAGAGVATGMGPARPARVARRRPVRGAASRCCSRSRLMPDGWVDVDERPVAGSSVSAAPPPRSRQAWRPAPQARRAARVAPTPRPAAMPCRTRSAVPRAPPSGALEPRRPLLDARHLRLDHVLTGPRPVEQLLVLGPRVLVGAVVVEHPLGVLQAPAARSPAISAAHACASASVPMRLAIPVCSATSAVSRSAAEQHAPARGRLQPTKSTGGYSSYPAPDRISRPGTGNTPRVRRRADHRSSRG